MTCSWRSKLVELLTCTFDVEETLHEVDGKSYCRFHLPMTDEKGNPTIKCEWQSEGTEFQIFMQTLTNIITNCRNHRKPCLFNGIIFPHPPSFSQFHDASGGMGVLVFDESVFPDRSSFRNVKLGSQSSFKSVRFGTLADFSNASFGHSVSFTDAIFGSHANFQNSTNLANLLFLNATFGVGADFSASPTSSENNDHSHLSKISFAGSEFLGGRGHALSSPDFSNRTFTGAVSFHKTIFHDPPGFHNTTFHQDTDFVLTKFLYHRGAVAARAYRTLKRAMTDAHSRIDAANFHALELKSTRYALGTPWPVRYMSLAYEIASDYGRSFVRPLVCLAVTLIVFMGLYELLAAAHDVSAFGESLKFGMEQIVRPFGVWPPGYEKILLEDSWLKLLLVEAPVLTRFLASLQSLISIGLITLFVLAVRRRFRMD